MTRQLQPCGTPAAYLRHWKRGEEPCDPCKEAHYAKNRARIKARRAEKADLPPCTNCRGERRHYLGLASKGWCEACRCRWESAGRPAEGPPPPCENPLALGPEGKRRKAAALREEYYSLRDLMGFTPEQAASDLDIAPITAHRWDARRRKAVNA